MGGPETSDGENSSDLSPTALLVGTPSPSARNLSRQRESRERSKRRGWHYQIPLFTKTVVPGTSEKTRNEERGTLSLPKPAAPEPDEESWAAGAGQIVENCLLQVER